jgi:phasin
MTVMAEPTTQAPAKKAKPIPAAAEMPKFEMPKFEMPSFDMPKIEVPAAFREMAEKGIAQCKDNYEKIKTAAEEATDVLEETYAAATKGASGYGLKVLENARANSNAAFDLLSELMTTKSVSEVVETSTAFWRERFDALMAQGKELADVAQKAATETSEPIKAGFSSAIRKAA